MDLKPPARVNGPAPQAPMVTPTPPLQEDPFKPDAPAAKPVKTKKSHKGFKVFLLVVLLLALMGAGGYGIFYWQHQHVDRLITQRGELQKQIADQQAHMTELENSAKDASAAPTTTSTTIKVSELGIQFAVPSSIKDLTYTITANTLKNGTKYTSASFSTKSLEAADKACTTAKGPLGSLTKVTGKYPADASTENSAGQLVVQFPTYYIGYVSSQSACSSNTANDSLQTSQQLALKGVLSPVTEVK